MSGETERTESQSEEPRPSATAQEEHSTSESKKDPSNEQRFSDIAVAPFDLDEIQPTENQADEQTDLKLILDVDLNVRVELGRAHLYIEDVLRLREGSIVPLEKLAGDPVDIYVNGRIMARGEVLVLNDNFCVRISEILGEATENTDTP